MTASGGVLTVTIFISPIGESALLWMKILEVTLLSFVDMAKQVNNTAFNQIIASFDTNLEKGIGTLLRSNYDGISRRAFTAIENLSKGIGDLTDDILRLNTDLKEYQELARMNVDFYM